MKRWILFFALLVSLAATIPASAIGIIIVHDQDFWPGPPRPIPPHPIPPRPTPPQRIHLFAPLEVNYAKINARVTDQIAVTTVDEEFYNPNSARLEGTFVFPVPKGAQIDKFTMEIDGKQVQAELLAADKARAIYEDIVRKMKDPALLEYAGRDLFKVRIFPIEPNSKKRITLSYSQLLKSDNNLVSYELPLNTEKFSAKPIKNVSVKLELQTTRPIKTIYSPSHTVEIKRDGANKAVVGFEAGDVKPDADFQVYFSTEKNELGVSLLTSKGDGEDGYFVLLASPGVDVKQKQANPKDVVFVLDTSGSMSGKKIEQAKKALLFCVENLNDNDRFEVVRFSTEVEPLFEKLADASKPNRDKANDFVKDLKAIGSTAIDDALQKALSLRSDKNLSLTPGFSPVSGRAEDDSTASAVSRSRKAVKTAESAPPENTGLKPGANERSGRPFVVIFLTDGRPTIGTTDEDEIVRHAKKSSANTRVFCFGIGTDVNTHLLDKITEETRAFSQYVLPEEDIEVKVSNFFAKIKEPVLANPTLKFTGDIRVSKIYPSPLPDIFKGEQLVVVGRYTGKGDSAVIIEGSVNGESKKISYDVRFPGETSDHEFIPRLWATRRVGYLLDEIRLRGENTELRDEVTDLARKYGIVTPYTAYLILEDEKQRGVPATAQSLPRIEADASALSLVTRAHQEFAREKSGEAGVGNARFANSLKLADAPAAALSEGRKDSYYALKVPALTATGGSGGSLDIARKEAQTRLEETSAQNRYTSGKNFFNNDGKWIDSAVQKMPDAKRVRIQFNSKEYFDFSAKNPKALPWLALGANVQFSLDGTVYEIYE